MNLLRQCSFIDRNRHMPIELDDIIEENYKKNTDELFYIILYFTANWLPDASNKHLNKKIESFYLNKNANQNKKLNFELIFISSDKTKSSYEEFLGANKYIRYSLAFQDQELKVKYNINHLASLIFDPKKVSSWVFGMSLGWDIAQNFISITFLNLGLTF